MNEPENGERVACPKCEWRGKLVDTLIREGDYVCPICVGRGSYVRCCLDTTPPVAALNTCPDRMGRMPGKRRCSAFDPLELYLPEGWTITPGDGSTWTVGSPHEVNTGFVDQWEALHHVWGHSLWPDSETNRLKPPEPEPDTPETILRRRIMAVLRELPPDSPVAGITVSGDPAYPDINISRK